MASLVIPVTNTTGSPLAGYSEIPAISKQIRNGAAFFNQPVALGKVAIKMPIAK